MSFDEFTHLQIEKAASMNRFQYLIYAKQQGFTLEFTLKILFPAKYR